MSGKETPPPLRHPPTRDANTLKSVVYGPGHEKFPSWPIAAAAEAPRATRAPPTGSSSRSKSWTDHTCYPKERPVVCSRPYMRRSHPQQLKTVLERCEKNTPETFEFFSRMERSSDARDGISSPPERDDQHKGLEEYGKLLQDQTLLRYSYAVLSREKAAPLTLADLEEYTRSCESIQHQKQPSYAQSEGYHSYVSSTDSTSTPFLDRLRRDIDTTVLRGSSWDHDSVVTTSSGSASSSETLKWHGSLSDVSVASSSNNLGRQQLIAHSARVQTPQRHNSESVLYIENNRGDVPSHHQSHYSTSSCSASQSAEPQTPSSLNYSPPSPQRSVAERVHQYEKQATKYTYLDPDKKTKLSDPALKAIQKNALLLFYERHQQGQKQNFWRSEPHLSFNSQSRTKSKYENHSKDKLHAHPHHMKENSQIEGDVSYNQPPSKPQLRVECEPTSPQGNTCSSNENVMSYLLKQKESSHTRSDMAYKQTENRPPSTLGYFKKNEQKHIIVKSPTSNLTKKILKSNSETSNLDFCKSPVNGSHETFITNSSPGFCKANESNSYHSHNSYPNVNPPVSTSPLINCENQNSDLQGPIIIGNSISIDDWVPERPPKNQELLRSAFPDLYRDKSRYHSPELPLPSPPLPTCDDEVLCSSDEPFPPPPLEIIDEWKYRQEVLDTPPPSEVLNYRQNATTDYQSNKNLRDLVFPDSKPEHHSRVMNFNKSPVPPMKPKPLKREYPSNTSKPSVASRRNSFANAQDISRDSPMVHANIRASVREKSHGLGYSPKPIVPMSAQRQLYRSITVDQTVVTPKKPINPFLRSTSMKFDGEYKSDNKISNYVPEKTMQPDKATLQYQFAQKLMVNGKASLATSEKVNRISGQYRAEPLRALFKPPQQDMTPVEQNTGDFKTNPEPKRYSLPPKYTECGKTSPASKKMDGSNRSFDSSDIKNVFSFCKSDVENISAKTADVRSTNLESPLKQSTHWSAPSSHAASPQMKPSHRSQPESKTLRRHNAVLAMDGLDRGSAEVNIGSYKRIIGSMEKSPPLQCNKEEITPVTPPPPKLEIPEDVAQIPESPTPDIKLCSDNGQSSEDSVSESSSSYLETPSSVPEFPEKEFLIQPTVVVSPEATPEVDSGTQRSPLVPITSKVQKLKARAFLPEETQWETLRSGLLLTVPPDSSLQNLISQFEGHNCTIESIYNICVVEVDETEDDKQSTIDLDIRNLKISDEENMNEDNRIKKEVPDKLDRLQESNDVNSIKICLSSLLSALTAECGRLEQAAAVNEAVGVQILATAPKGARLSRHAADVGRVTALIAGLATRLARATQPLKLPVHTPERRRLLMTKQEKLADQLEEAKRLKESIDSRGLSLAENLATQLSEDFKEQFKRFVATKVQLVVYLRDIQNRLELTKQILDSFLQENYAISLSPDATRLL